MSYFSSSYGENSEERNEQELNVIPRNEDSDFIDDDDENDENDDEENKYVYLPNTEIYKEEYMITNNNCNNDN